MAKQHVRGGAQGKATRLDRIEERPQTAHKIVGLRERVKHGLCTLDEAKDEAKGMKTPASRSLVAWLKRR